MNAPKKIWVYPDLFEEVSLIKCMDYDVPYIRADLVDGLVAALEELLDQFDSEIRSEYGGTSMLESRLAEADHARAALAKLEE
jgi:hypothetical protein